MTSEIRDKDGVPVHVGDYVKTANRQGQVQAIFTNNTVTPSEKADDVEVAVTIKHPPKVVFLDKKGTQVSHNPSVLSHASRNESDINTTTKTNASKGQDAFTSSGEIQGKDGLPIHIGETVMTPYRGGKLQGEVEAIFTDNTTTPAEKEPGHDVHVAVVNPPKIVFTTQKNKQVYHNPSALSHVD
ncbi:hypothetical protein Clacol_002746 [Clathrus columnatus]|uniref:Hypervirulence associated protein TUDOR domain-containing protein n=1 Tax=Clathrus columnatus TaxID=1419009 RepID=A0AAV5A5P2_9AGAM|nr:hypothetical protein Clacol_002746 [Clathrus columnatus]